jgi:hypothetical protein
VRGALCAHPAPPRKFNLRKDIAVTSGAGHRACDDAGNETRGGMMLWMLAVLMGGLGFGWVTVRRRRKADHKAS